MLRVDYIVIEDRKRKDSILMVKNLFRVDGRGRGDKKINLIHTHTHFPMCYQSYELKLNVNRYNEVKLTNLLRTLYRIHEPEGVT